MGFGGVPLGGGGRDPLLLARVFRGTLAEPARLREALLLLVLVLGYAALREPLGLRAPPVPSVAWLALLSVRCRIKSSSTCIADASASSREEERASRTGVAV